jgi:hypothetical protein
MLRGTFLGKKKVVDWKTQQIIKLKCCGRKKIKEMEKSNCRLWLKHLLDMFRNIGWHFLDLLSILNLLTFITTL